MLTAKMGQVIRAHWAIWIEARKAETGQLAPAGFWTGDDARSIVVDGVPRTYFGAGAAIQIDPITYEAGALVRTQRVSLGGLAPEVITTLRGYETRQAAAQIHLICLDDLDGITAVEMAFDGVVDHVEISESEVDENGVSTVACDVDLVSNARHLTRTLSAKMSDASQRLREPNDRFRRYADVAAEVRPVWMGETKDAHWAKEKR